MPSHSNQKTCHAVTKYGVHTNNTIDQIDRELNLHGCHVVGVQESCVQGNVTREQQEFVALTNVAQQNWPHLVPDLLARDPGCDLWF